MKVRFISHACFNQELLRSELLVRELTLHKDLALHSPFDIVLLTPIVTKNHSEDCLSKNLK
jgi:hypothetical protein